MHQPTDCRVPIDTVYLSTLHSHALVSTKYLYPFPFMFAVFPTTRGSSIRRRYIGTKASVLHAYSNESRELDKQLALFPPTYHQFLAVRAKATCRRRQRSATLDTGRKDSHPSSVSHSLNFHLTNGVHVADRNTDYQHFDRVHDDVIEGTIDMQNYGPSVGVEREARLDSDYFRREEGVERAGGDDSGYCSAWPAGQSPPKSHVALEDIIESVTTAEECRKVKRGGVMDRRWSTRARWVARLGAVGTALKVTTCKRLLYCREK